MRPTKGANEEAIMRGRGRCAAAFAATLAMAAALAAAGCASGGAPHGGGAAAAEEAGSPLARAAFLRGAWAMERDGTRWEEHWTGAAGATMLGMSRVIEGGRTIWVEYLRLEERGENLYYIAAPGGGTPVEFRRTEAAPGSAVFENPRHDFPTKVTYRREGERLHARVEGEFEGRHTVQEWAFDPIR
jgi:hypothetical protein